MHKQAKLDHEYVWHPFTQMQDWLQREPIVIARGKGAVLRDVYGQSFLDANSSIWTNLHGHSHPRLNAALRRQARLISHSSALGFASIPASSLAAKLVQLANQHFVDENHLGLTSIQSPVKVGSAKALTDSAAVPSDLREQPEQSRASSRLPHFERVFFSDDGSTAIEVALKMSFEYARRSGRSRRPKYLSLVGAYHGDTIGAVSLGHIDLFHKAYSPLLFKSARVNAPYCYRCPFNRAQPERSDAREYRRCNWECIDAVARKVTNQRMKRNPFAAMVVEPLMQGAAGMIAQPRGWLKRVDEVAKADGMQLIADEVMTGFGRTGTDFGYQAESVQPDYLVLAKGLTGGYLPMAATLTTGKVFDAFLGDYAEFKTFFHGHSFTGNQLGAVAAMASLELLQTQASINNRARIETVMRDELSQLWGITQVGDIRQVGLIVGIELVRNWRTREAFQLTERAGIRVCEAMAKRGVLTRPIGNVVPLIPPYCMTSAQVRKIVGVLAESIREIFPIAHPKS